MKKSIILFLGLNIFFNAVFVKAEQILENTIINNFKEQKITVKATIKPAIDMKMTLPGSSRLIESLKLMPSKENPLVYDASQQASISTLGHDPGHKLSISLVSPLILTKAATRGARSGESHTITAVRVFFKNQELTADNPAEFIPENNKVEGLLVVAAEVNENDKMGAYSGEFTLRIEETA